MEKQKSKGKNQRYIGRFKKVIAGIRPSLFYFAKAAKKPATADKSAKQTAGRHTEGGFATADKSSLSFDLGGEIVAIA